MNTPWPWLDGHAGNARFGFVRRDGTGLLGAGIAEQVDGTSIGDVLTTVPLRAKPSSKAASAARLQATQSLSFPVRKSSGERPAPQALCEGHEDAPRNLI